MDVTDIRRSRNDLLELLDPERSLQAQEVQNGGRSAEIRREVAKEGRVHRNEVRLHTRIQAER